MAGNVLKNWLKLTVLYKEEKFFEWANNPKEFAESKGKAYMDSVQELERRIRWYVENAPDFELNMYGKILERNNIVWNSTSMRMADVSELDA